MPSLCTQLLEDNMACTNVVYTLAAIWECYQCAAGFVVRTTLSFSQRWILAEPAGAPAGSPDSGADTRA